MWGRLGMSHPWLRRYCQLMTAGNIQLSPRMQPLRSYPCPKLMVVTPKLIQATIKLNEFRNKSRKECIPWHCNTFRICHKASFQQQTRQLKIQTQFYYSWERLRILICFHCVCVQHTMTVMTRNQSLQTKRVSCPRSFPIVAAANTSIACLQRKPVVHRMSCRHTTWDGTVVWKTAFCRCQSHLYNHVTG